MIRWETNELIKTSIVSIGIGVVIGASIALMFEFYSLLDSIRTFMEESSRGLIVILTAVGLFLAYLLVQGFAATKSTGCGTSQVIEAYHYRRGLISTRDFISKTLASAVTIGFGGSAGLEGPSLLLGGGVGSAIAQKLRFTPGDVQTFMMAGAAAGLSAIFKAPLTGILFALEIPFRKHLAKEVFVPASLSSVTSYITFISIKGGESLFPVIPGVSLSLTNALYATLEGVMVAIVGLAFVAFFRTFESRMAKTGRSRLLFPLSLIGGVTVGCIGLFYPQVLGIGYDTISLSASGKLYGASMLMLIAILALKIVATTITLSFGGSGGLFIPSIFVGAVFGVIYTKLINAGPNEILVMAAMAAMIATTNKTLLTSIAFVAETCGPSSIIPTTIAACISYVISGNWSFYEAQLPREAEEEEKALTELHYLAKLGFLSESAKMKVKEIMRRNPVAISEDMSIKETFSLMNRYEFRVYPVVDGEGRLIGIVRIEDILALPVEKWSLLVSHIVMKTPLVTLETDDVYDLMEEMIQRDEDHAYVVSDKSSMKLIGVVSGIDIVRGFLKRAAAKTI